MALTKTKKERIIAMYEAGYWTWEIAKELDLDEVKVVSVIQRYLGKEK